jgi:hypothetical protein
MVGLAFVFDDGIFRETGAESGAVFVIHVSYEASQQWSEFDGHDGSAGEGVDGGRGKTGKGGRAHSGLKRSAEQFVLLHVVAFLGAGGRARRALPRAAQQQRVFLCELNP